MRKPRLSRTITVIAACSLLGATAGIAGSMAAPSKSSKKHAAKKHTKRHGYRYGATGPSGPGGPGRPGRGRGFGPGGPGGPGVHSEAVVPNKAGDGFITITSDNGKVKSVDGSTLVVTDGTDKLTYKDVTITVPDGATVVRNHAKAALSDLKAGDFVHVMQSTEGTFIFAEDAAFRASEKDHGPGGPGDRDGHGPPPGAPGPPPPAP